MPSHSNRIAADAHHLKIVLAEDLLANGQMERVLDGFVVSDRDEDYGYGALYGHGPQPLGYASIWKPTDNGRTVCGDLYRHLQASETFYVAGNMGDLAYHASEAFPDEPLLPPDLPSTHGFMLLAHSYRMIDIRMKALSINALMWATYGGGVNIYAFTHRDDPNDSINLRQRQQWGDEFFRANMPLLTLNHAFHLDFGQPLPRSLSWDTSLPPDANVEIHDHVNPDGSHTMTWASDHYIDNTKAPSFIRSPFAAYCITLWRLCQQTLADRHVEPTDRNTRRRLGKVNLPDKPITYITLRRRAAPAEGEGSVEWSHRWMVRGHWRQAWVNDGAGGKIQRAVYINPYIKGPEDKPLVIREHVNVLKR